MTFSTMPARNFRPDPRAAAVRDEDETLIVDSRAALTPAQQVEQRLLGLLSTSPVLISQVQRTLRPARN